MELQQVLVTVEFQRVEPTRDLWLQTIQQANLLT